MIDQLNDTQLKHLIQTFQNKVVEQVKELKEDYNLSGLDSFLFRYTTKDVLSKTNNNLEQTIQKFHRHGGPVLRLYLENECCTTDVANNINDFVEGKTDVVDCPFYVHLTTTPAS